MSSTAGGRFYNSAVIIDADGTLHTPYHKVHIPQDPGIFEKGYFYPGSGYQVHTTRYGRIAVLICYDQWFPEAARSVALEGAEIIFYPTAIGHPTSTIAAEGNWQEAWELIERGHAVANSVHVAALNRVGKEANIRFFVHGRVGRSHHDFDVIGVEVFAAVNGHEKSSLGFFFSRRAMPVGRFVRRSAESPFFGSQERDARLAFVDGVVFAQRMALELGVEQQMAKIRALLK